MPRSQLHWTHWRWWLYPIQSYIWPEGKIKDDGWDMIYLSLTKQTHLLFILRRFRCCCFVEQTSTEISMLKWDIVTDTSWLVKHYTETDCQVWFWPEQSIESISIFQVVLSMTDPGRWDHRPDRNNFIPDFLCSDQLHLSDQPESCGQWAGRG